MFVFLFTTRDKASIGKKPFYSEDMAGPTGTMAQEGGCGGDSPLLFSTEKKIFKDMSLKTALNLHWEFLTSNIG